MNVYIRQHLFDRWIVIDGEYPTLAWSGSSWVRIGGYVQVSNFDSWEEAAAYAESFGFVVVGRLGLNGIQDVTQT